MSHTLVLELPEAAYAELIRSASQKGSQPERVAADILADVLTDPLMQLAGSISSPISDVAERHDEYLGVELLSRHDEL